MTSPSRTLPDLWGLHAGRYGNAHQLFMQKQVAAIGWPKVPDLSALSADREAFKAAVLGAYPESPGAVPVNAGQLYRFVHEMKDGDLVVYPSSFDRQIHLGKVIGAYHYDPATEPAYPHQRPVQWLTAVPRTQFTQGALHEIGSAMSLFKVRTYADEFRSALGGNAPIPKLDDEEEAVELVAEQIEENTRDFILKQLARELKGHPFAEFVAHLLETLGYHTRLAPPGPDGGVDIIAHRDELGFEPPIIKVQVKSTQGPVGQPEINQLKGTLGVGECGLLVTLGTFAPRLKQLGLGQTHVRLLDGDDFVNLVMQQYDLLAPRYKGLVPLKRVLIPQPSRDGSSNSSAS